MEWDRAPGGSSGEHLHLGNRHPEKWRGDRKSGPQGATQGEGTENFRVGVARGCSPSSKDDHEKGPQILCQRVSGTPSGFLRRWVEEHPVQGFVLCCLFICPNSRPRARTEPGACRLAGWVLEWTEVLCLRLQRGDSSGHGPTANHHWIPSQTLPLFLTGLAQRLG